MWIFAIYVINCPPPKSLMSLFVFLFMSVHIKKSARLIVQHDLSILCTVTVCRLQHTWRVDKVGKVKVQLLDRHSDVVWLDTQARVGALWGFDEPLSVRAL